MSQDSAVDELTLATIEAVSQNNPLLLIDGLPLLEWYQESRLEQMQKVLILLEGAAPAVAAAFQTEIDKVRRDA